MEIRRFYVSESDISDGKVVIKGGEHLHLSRILRLKEGYYIVVSDGGGMDYNCVITEINRDRTVAAIQSVSVNENSPLKKATLYQCLPKGDKSDYIVQKAVELGAARIVFFITEFTAEKSFKKERLDKIAVQACKQCGRAECAAVEGLLSLDDALADMGTQDAVIFPYERASGLCIKDCRDSIVSAQNLGVVIGCEGGFTENEAEKISKSGALTVTMGKRILRAETASIAALALVMHEAGELQ